MKLPCWLPPPQPIFFIYCACHIKEDYEIALLSVYPPHNFFYFLHGPCYIKGK
jgi:hypothetical protein